MSGFKARGNLTSPLRVFSTNIVRKALSETHVKAIATGSMTSSLRKSLHAYPEADAVYLAKISEGCVSIVCAQPETAQPGLYTEPG